MLNAIAKPFGILLLWLYEFLNNYGFAVILFALIVKVILLPFMMKSKRGSLRTQSIQPLVAELQKLTKTVTNNEGTETVWDHTKTYNMHRDPYN